MGSTIFQVKCYPNARNHQTVLTIRDISDLKEKDKEIQESVIASREINHRVKIICETIISLLWLQGAQVKESGTKVAEDCINWIFSIAATLWASSGQEHEQIDLKSLIEIVSSNLQRCFAERPDIQLKLELCDQIYLDHNRASSLVLVINELLQNAIWACFSNKNIKKIKKSMYLLANDEKDDIICIQVIDNGSGYNARSCGQEHLV